MKSVRYVLISLLLTTASFRSLYGQRPVYQDIPYIQDYSVKYYLADTSIQLLSALTDRNGVTSVLSSRGLLSPDNGRFQYPGALKPNGSYRPMADRKIRQQAVVQRQFVYLDETALFSNAWAGKLLVRHGLPEVRSFCAGAPQSATFLFSDGRAIRAVRDSTVIWEGQLAQDRVSPDRVSPDRVSPDRVRDLRYDKVRDRFWVLGDQSLSYVSLKEKTLKTVHRGAGLTCFEIADNRLYLGTRNGYLMLDADRLKPVGGLHQKLPCNDLTAIAFLNGALWFGSREGAFALQPDGKYNYYAGERWLPGDRVVHLAAGEGNTVLILTTKGLGEIHFQPMTLHEKAMVYEKQVRQRHIRYGFNCDVSRLKNGDLSTFEMGQRDSDNLWTAMYLVSQLYRYKVTGEEEARQNCLESFEAMERLFTITGMNGYFARGFERRGSHSPPAKEGSAERHNGWVRASEKEWDWRGTTSSDQTVGQLFALTQMAELMDGDVKKRAVHLIDQLMSAIIRNDWYLIDFDGKPTLWGKWHPDYVNGFPTMVGDRKVNSSNIIGFLQAAYHFTGKKIYKEKAYELMEKHGYLENLLRPIAQLGKAPESAGDWAKMLSEAWNHSDDEMYFLAYWCLYPYAFDDGLKAQYRAAIKDHWEAERPEKDGLWNLCYAMTGASEFDLRETVWYLQEFPLDMIEWRVVNSRRKDIQFVAPNFRGQTITEVLPPDERPELKHNRNLFKLDRQENGESELSAGDSFLLPYWMGRYLGVISAPVTGK